jgi:ribonuclease G
VSEVVRQLRLRDIGGIIVIDFIDMANPKNRATVEEALRSELERDRTKTYVVEISPLGLVEMTRQNVTEGPREVLTKKCPTCSGDGIVVSETTAAVDVERRIRALVRGSRSKAFRIELNAAVAELLIGPGATRLQELEGAINRRLVFDARNDVPLDHLTVVAHGQVEKVVPQAAIAEGSELTVKLVEVGLYDVTAAAGEHKDLKVSVAGAAKLVGKRVRARVERVLNDTAYAILVEPAAKAQAAPITAESLAEKPTRTRVRTKAQRIPVDEAEEAADQEAEQAAEQAADQEAEQEAEQPDEEAPEEAEEQAKRKKTRRGTRGGRGRRRKVEAAPASADGDAPAAAAEPARIHLPEPDLGQDHATAEATNGEESAEKPRKKTRRGSRGGRGRKRKPSAAPAEPQSDAVEAR